MDYSVFQQLGVAIALSSLIGLEREHRYQVDGYREFGGIRTYALIGLMGALAYILSSYYTPLFAVITAGFLGLLIAAYVVTTAGKKYAGGTSEVAAILVYIIGILSAMEQYVVATSVSLGILLVLYFRQPLHKWAKHIKNRELISTIQFIIIAFVVLPLLPNQTYGPYDFFNPYIVWLMIVFISGISFLSYIGIKLFGAKKGITLTGFLAGMISSTALCFSFSSQSRKNVKVIYPYVLAIIIAGSAMFFRVLIEVVVLNSALFKDVLIPVGSMGLAGILISWFLWRKKEKMPEEVEKGVQNLKSPFSMWPAVKFGVFFAFVLFLSKFAVEFWGDKGVYLTSAVSGVVDVDAITVSMANLSKNGLSEITAAKAVILATIINTFSKAGIFLIFGNRKVAVRILIAFLIMGSVGAGLLVLV